MLFEERLEGSSCEAPPQTLVAVVLPVAHEARHSSCADPIAEADIEGRGDRHHQPRVPQPLRLLQRDRHGTRARFQPRLAEPENARLVAVQAGHRLESRPHCATSEESGDSRAGRMQQHHQHRPSADSMGLEEAEALELAVVLAHLGSGHRTLGGAEQGDGRG